MKKADYWTVIMFGTLEDFKEKLNMEQKQLKQVINFVDDRGISLLQQSLISRKFDLTELLLDEGATVNNISNDSYNELHYVAAHLDDTRAIQLAHRFVDQGVDLDLLDTKYGNSAFFTISYEAFKVGTNEANKLIISCLKRQPNVELQNRSGYSVKQVIEERGTEEMKRAMSFYCK